MVFPRQLKHAREMVDFLIRLHLCNALRKHTSICPIDIPILLIARIVIIIVVVHVFYFLLFEIQLEVEKSFGHEPDNKILCIAYINHQSFFIFEFGIVVIVFNPNSLCKVHHFSMHSLLSLLLLRLLVGLTWRFLVTISDLLPSLVVLLVFEI